MSRFVPPFSLGGFKPSPATLAEFIYQIWLYLQANPIMPEAEIKEEIIASVPPAVKDYVENNPELSQAIAGIVNDYLVENPPEAPVQSVNQQTGNVVIDYKSLVPSNIQIPVFIHNTASTPTGSTIVGLRTNGFRFTFNSDTNKLSIINADYTITEVASGDVISVNGKTGSVTLTASDIEVDPSDGDTTLKDISDRVSAIDTILDGLLGVGAIYVTKSALFDPNTVFPGTWARLEHAFIYGAGTNDTVNDTIQGNESYSLTLANTPEHNHELYNWTMIYNIYNNGKFLLNLSSGENTGNVDVYFDVKGAQPRYSGTAGSNPVTPIPTMPPHLYRYIWERTA